MAWTKEKQKECMRKYYIRNKNKIRKQQRPYKKEYDKKNKERLNKYAREYYRNHLGKFLKNSKNFKKNNPTYFKEYRDTNRGKLKVKRNKRMKKRRVIDKEFRIKANLRTRISYILKYYTKTGKIMSASKYGINYKAIIQHLKPFPEDLSNYEIDHIKPLVSFNFLNEDGSTNLKKVKIAFAPENHQWLLASENRIKGSKII